MSIKACDILTNEQLLKAIDKGLKSYEDLIGADVLENNKSYIKLCEVLTYFQMHEADFTDVQKAFNSFTNSL